MKELFHSFWTDESGQGLTEYALIIAIVSLGVIIVMFLFRNALGDVFNKMRNTLNTIPGQGDYGG